MSSAPRPALKQSQHVLVLRPEPQVWQEALRLAAGDPRRIEVRSDGSVIVHNRRIR